ncbi:ferric-dicitrate binding protein FerR (iron transport regulator) [Rhabdobacter roseus]|uniref:Ferric-dicitrate binding protein FerR (Iron transport regulator) n=1 Tax=Rhabdobacter roseus TaxID=1655419 RepID=A0A840TU03_9BACT|nr:FecR domain-containing protein [Rhabdobacter roseus]MBB5286385.1 ferric-dicitrate binding protein FerR (iron transport regulator) [Rhabdobacter roseus]
MKTDISKALIFDHFARKTSPLQRKRIEEWLQLESNEEQYYAWLEEWEHAHLQYVAPTEVALESYATFLEANPLPLRTPEEAPLGEQSRNPARIGGMQWLVAASILLVLGLGGWISRDTIRYKTYQTAYGEIQRFQLADGSTVKLNTNSSLRVPRWGFGDKTREVFLTGEANFSVTHTPTNQRFIVKTPKGFDVVVLGTEFTMYARKHNSKVVLNKGKVQVRYQEENTQKEVTMKPGDLVTFDRQNNVQLRTTQQAPSYAAWEEQRFVFEETSLEEVAYLLQENYGLRVEIKGQNLSERVLMGSFRARNLDELLLTISELLDISVVRQENRVQMADK